jgi:hypothetical protein
MPMMNCCAIAELMLWDMNDGLTQGSAPSSFATWHKDQPLFSNARAIRNALDRLRLRQAELTL